MKEKNTQKGIVDIDTKRKEQDMIERFKNGDREAFDEIFEAYSSRLLGFLTRMCGDREDAKESLQDTFLNIFRYLKNFRGEASLKNWVFKIAVTTCLKKKRKMQALQGVEKDSMSCTAIGKEASWAEQEMSGFFQGMDQDPEKLYLDREFHRAVIQGVASMPYIYKIVINLRDFEGFSTEEVSRILGIKPSTVKVRLHRARLYLKEWLKRRYKS